MDIEVVNIDSRGSGYAVVHCDDGSSYGLQFRRAPIDSPTTLMEHLSSKVATIEQTRIEATTEAPPLPVSIRNIVNQRTPVVRKRGQE